MEQFNAPTIQVNCTNYYTSLSYFSVRAVFHALQLSDLITSEECMMLSDISDVLKLQSTKSLDVMAKTADTVRKLGYEEEWRFCSGEVT